MIRKLKRASTIWQEQGFSGLVSAIQRRQAAPAVPPTPAPTLKPIEQNWTPYLSWLTFANAGMLTRGNVYSLEHAIRNLPTADPIIEIGSFCGLSANVIGYLKQRYQVKNPLVTCDRWEFEGAAPGKLLDEASNLSHDDYRQFVKDTFARNVKMFSGNDLPYTIEAFSDEFFAMWNAGELRQDVFGREFKLGGPISLCYIDGNHTYEFTKRDFENCDRSLVPGGFVLFDDSSDNGPFEGVSRAVQEVMASGRYQLIAKNPNYLFQKK